MSVHGLFPCVQIHAHALCMHAFSHMHCICMQMCLLMNVGIYTVCSHVHMHCALCVHVPVCVHVPLCMYTCAMFLCVHKYMHSQMHGYVPCVCVHVLHLCVHISVSIL